MFTFSVNARLRTKADFASLRNGTKFVCGGVRLVYVPNQLKHARIGFAVSRKYGNAVQRNRLKRLWRECFRSSTVRHIGVDVLAIPACLAPHMKQPVKDMQQALDYLSEKIRRRNIS